MEISDVESILSNAKTIIANAEEMIADYNVCKNSNSKMYLLAAIAKTVAPLKQDSIKQLSK